MRSAAESYIAPMAGDGEPAPDDGETDSVGWDSLEVPGSEPVADPEQVDSAFNRIRHGWPGALRTVDTNLRRMQGYELLVVLAVFPLGSAYEALQDLTQRVQSGYPVVSHAIPPLNGNWLPVGFSIASELIELAPVLLVWYLLTRSGERLQSINLGAHRFRMDLALVLPVYIVAQWLPQLIGAHILSGSGLHGYYLDSTPVPISYGALTTQQLVGSAVAGLLEEVVVLGYLVRRLEQRGFGIVAVVIIDVLVRTSYHLYYGWNVIPIAVWALASVLVYLRIRRLLPFIVCHVIWDAAIPLRAFYHGAYQVLEVIAIALGIALTCLWARWSPEPTNQVLSPGLLP